MAKQNWKPGNMLYPVPAVMVSCARQGEKPNIITVAWAGTICSDPAMVSVSIRPERYSYNIIEETKEFVINLVTEELAFATDYCGVRSGRDIDKFKELKLTAQQSAIVRAGDSRKSAQYGVRGQGNQKARQPRYVCCGDRKRYGGRAAYGRKGQVRAQQRRTCDVFSRGIFYAWQKIRKIRVFRSEKRKMI